MPEPIAAIATVAGGALQARSARRAAEAQSEASQAGVEEQRRQFDEIRRLLQPYVDVGSPALQGMEALVGLGGADAQRAAIQRIERSPFLQSQIEAGERALLQQAGATGGLRGGNLQAALAQFRPQMLQQAIEQQYGRLAGLTSLGQQSAVGVGNAGIQTGGQIAGLLQQQGAAQAGGILGQASPFVQMSQIPMQLAVYGMATGRNLFGGNPIQAAFSQTGLGASGFGTGLAYGNQDFGQFL
jgi:hypothetical protein